MANRLHVPPHDHRSRDPARQRLRLHPARQIQPAAGTATTRPDPRVTRAGQRRAVLCHVDRRQRREPGVGIRAGRRCRHDPHSGSGVRRNRRLRRHPPGFPGHRYRDCRDEICREIFLEWCQRSRRRGSPRRDDRNSIRSASEIMGSYDAWTVQRSQSGFAGGRSEGEIVIDRPGTGAVDRIEAVQSDGVR